MVIKTVLCLFSHHISLQPATRTIIHWLNQQINFDSVCYLATFNVNVAQPYLPIPFHAVPSIIAINMIMAGVTGGIVVVIIASCLGSSKDQCKFMLIILSQINSASESMNANEIANAVLSALVAITAGCPFVEYWAACLIGGICINI